MADNLNTKESKLQKIEFIKNHINNMTYAEIAKELKCNQSYIGKIIKDAGIHRDLPSVDLISDEEFRSLKDLGYSSYEISNYGKIRNVNTKKYLSPQKNRDGGYMMIRLISDNKGANNSFKNIGRLMALTFIENDDKENKTEIKFIDGDKENLSVSNIVWVSKSEAHKSNNTHRHNKDNIIKVCEMLADKKSINEVLKAYPEISYRTIRKIKNKEIWKDVVSNYKF